MSRLHWIAIAALVLGCSGRAARPAPAGGGQPAEKPAGPPSQVIVMGMIHDGHRKSSTYGVGRVKQIVWRIRPDFILAEIPPDRLDAALAQYRDTGAITEPRVSRFPEYVDAIIPIMTEVGFSIIPCAGWTKAMAEDRSAKLLEWKTSRPAETAEVSRAMQLAEDRIAAEGLDSTPAGIHSERYDELVALGMEPYDRLFNDGLGPGGWSNINAAHYALITAALDAHRNEGKRFLITFGAWHKYWFLRKLRTRGDIELRPLTDYLGD